MFSMMCNLLRNSGEHLFTLPKSLVSSLCESEMSEMKVRVCRCTMWKAHQRLFNDTVEQLCPITDVSENVME